MRKVVEKTPNRVRNNVSHKHIFRGRDAYNKDMVNIFTDAGSRRNDGKCITCPAVMVYVGGTLVHQSSKILPNTTTNQGELIAIKMGFIEAIKFRNLGYTNINIFSDSLGSILALRERIFNWINNVRDGVMYGCDGPIANTSIIFEIMHLIIDYRLDVNLYHVKAHLRSNNILDINKGRRVFSDSNGVPIHKLSDDFIIYIINGNNQVDKYAGFILDYYWNNSIPNYNPCLEYLYTPNMDYSLYKSLIKNK